MVHTLFAPNGEICPLRHSSTGFKGGHCRLPVGIGQRPAKCRILGEQPSMPYSVQALLICVALWMAGVAFVMDDYGTGWDAEYQLQSANANLEFIQGRIEMPSRVDRYYGVTFTLPMILIQRLLGLEDKRSVHFSKHMLTHAFFLVGGFFCSLLTYRMFNSRLLALLALLLFVLHPRLYGPSFYNSKDLPFLAMFMITLYLMHRAFRKDTWGAFLFCGVGVGFLVNLRIMGILLFGAVLALRTLDLLCESAERRKHVLATAGVFVAVCLCTLYVVSPYLWENPLELLTALRVLAHHPAWAEEIFQGSLVSSKQLPAHFIPTWMAISTPPVTLALGAIGAAVLCVRSAVRPRDAFGNTALRFEMLLIVLLTGPVLAVAFLGSHVYDAWRHMFFLHAPLCLLGTIGLHWLGSSMRRRFGAWPAVSCTLAGVGLTVAAAEMVRIHPQQQAYFNFFVDRSTSEHLRAQYEMDPRMDACREGLVYLLERHPNATMLVNDGYPVRKGRSTLPKADRDRLIPVRQGWDFAITCGRILHGLPADDGDAVHVRKLYGSTILRVYERAGWPSQVRQGAYFDKGDYGWFTTSTAEAGQYRQGAYVDRQDFLLGNLLAQSTFHIRYKDNVFTYYKEPCAWADSKAKFFLHIYPKNIADLPEGRRQHRFDNLDFWFSQRGAYFRVDGVIACATRADLPDYDIARIKTGQWTDGAGRLWTSDVAGWDLNRKSED